MERKCPGFLFNGVYIFFKNNVPFHPLFSPGCNEINRVPDRYFTCLSNEVLSHSRSCLAALSCRSSFLICSNCQWKQKWSHYPDILHKFEMSQHACFFFHYICTTNFSLGTSKKKLLNFSSNLCLIFHQCIVYKKYCIKLTFLHYFLQ